MYYHMGWMRLTLVLFIMCLVDCCTQTCEGGLLFLASHQSGDNPAAVANPNIQGALITLYWSQIETRDGTYDWTEVDRRIQTWVQGGKKVALRFVWSADGNWPTPWATHPSPQWLIDRGAAIIVGKQSQTQVPLQWDPIYQRYVSRFVQEIARKFDGDPNILFIDLTPGAETNPYRVSLKNTDPGIQRDFLNTAASDGRRYSDALWLDTVRSDIDHAAESFHRTKVLVTLNVGSLQGPALFDRIGNYCLSKHFYVGQNGLKGNSYLDEKGPWHRSFLKWGGQTSMYFEMFGPTGHGNGSLMEIMRAAERAHANYLGVYASDVLRGTQGQPKFDPAFAAALAYGARVVGK